MARTRALPSYDEVVALPRGHRVTVPPEHGDPNGHLNVRHYLGLFDDAEWVVFEGVDLGSDLAERGVGGIFALEQHLTYRREVLVGDEVSVHLRFVGRTEQLMHLVSYLANHTRREVAASMEALDGYVDFGTRRLAPVPQPQASGLDRLLEQAAGLPWTPALSGSISLG
ncbi:MAG: thioesterase family protein [Nocardioides sp.]